MHFICISSRNREMSWLSACLRFSAQMYRKKEKVKEWREERKKERISSCSGRQIKIHNRAAGVESGSLLAAGTHMRRPLHTPLSGTRADFLYPFFCLLVFVCPPFLYCMSKKVINKKPTKYYSILTFTEPTLKYFIPDTSKNVRKLATFGSLFSGEADAI